MTEKSRSGLLLFAIYVALYAGFIFLAVFRTEALAEPVLAGVNLATVYGLGLILAALVLAVAYMMMRRGEREEEPS